MDAPLLLTLDRPDVSVEDFAEAAQALVAVVREVASVVTGDARPPLRWIVRGLRAGSAVLEAEPEVGGSYDEAVVDAILTTTGEGMLALEAGDSRPPAFTDAALRQARRLATVLSDGEAGTGSVRFGRVLVTPTARLVATVDDEVRGTLKSLGAVEGVLLMVSKRDDGYRFSVEDRLRGVRVECRFRDALLQQVLAAFAKRVSVLGVVWSRRDGQPTLVEVRHFEVLEDDAQLPRAWEVRGILRDISYSAEYD